MDMLYSSKNPLCSIVLTPNNQKKKKNVCFHDNNMHNNGLLPKQYKINTEKYKRLKI